jgi:hypothetical protein
VQAAKRGLLWRCRARSPCKSDGFSSPWGQGEGTTRASLTGSTRSRLDAEEPGEAGDHDENDDIHQEPRDRDEGDELQNSEQARHKPSIGTGGRRQKAPRSLFAWVHVPASARRRAVVEFGLVEEDVTVGIRGHGEVSLADLLADPRPGDAAKVEEADPA